MFNGGGGATAAASSTDTFYLAPPWTQVVGRRRQRVCLSPKIALLGQTGSHVTITVWSTMFPFSPLLPSFILAFFLPSLPCLSLCFLSPPRRPYAGIFLSFVLLRPVRQLYVLPEYVCFPSMIINSSLSDLVALFFYAPLSFCSYLYALVLLVCCCVLTSLTCSTLP